MALFILTEEHGVQRCRVHLAVGDSGGEASVVGASREDATPSVAIEQQQLRRDLLAGVFHREPVPESEPTDIEQLLAVIQQVPPTHATR